MKRESEKTKRARVRRKGQRRRRREPEQCWVVMALYKGRLNLLLDDAMRAVAGFSSDGSGYDFVRGQRDITWSCYRESLARFLAEQLKLFRGVRTKVLAPS